MAAYLVAGLGIGLVLAFMIYLTGRWISQLESRISTLEKDLTELKGATRGQRLTYAFLEEIENIAASVGMARIQNQSERERLDTISDIAGRIMRSWKEGRDASK